MIRVHILVEGQTEESFVRELKRSPLANQRRQPTRQLHWL